MKQNHITQFNQPDPELRAFFGSSSNSMHRSKLVTNSTPGGLSQPLFPGGHCRSH